MKKKKREIRGYHPVFSYRQIVTKRNRLNVSAVVPIIAEISLFSFSVDSLEKYAQLICKQNSLRHEEWITCQMWNWSCLISTKIYSNSKNKLNVFHAIPGCRARVCERVRQARAHIAFSQRRLVWFGASPSLCGALHTYSNVSGTECLVSIRVRPRRPLVSLNLWFIVQCCCIDVEIAHICCFEPKTKAETKIPFLITSSSVDANSDRIKMSNGAHRHTNICIAASWKMSWSR